MDQQCQQDLQERRHAAGSPPKRYKAYAEPQNANLDLPRATAWRRETGIQEAYRPMNHVQAYDEPVHLHQLQEEEREPVPPVPCLVQERQLSDGSSLSDGVDIRETDSDEGGNSDNNDREVFQRQNHASSSEWEGEDSGQDGDRNDAQDLQVHNDISCGNIDSEQDGDASDQSGNLEHDDFQQLQRAHRQDTSEGEESVARSPGCSVRHQPERAHSNNDRFGSECNSLNNSIGLPDENHDLADLRENDSDSDYNQHPIEDSLLEDFELSDDSDSEPQDILQGQPQGPPHEQPLPPPTPAHNLLRTKLQGHFSERINDRVVCSRGEILLNIQEFCNKHPVPLTAQEALHQMINSMFYKEVVPDTKYKLDKLYSSTNTVKYHFYCSNCFKSFRDLDHKTVRVKKCDHCQTDNVVSDLTKATCFVTFDFTKQLQLLLENPELAASLKNPDEFSDNGEDMYDIYDGLVYKQFVTSLDFSQRKFYISLTACTDGTPVFESSALSIWPLFVIVNELPHEVRTSNVLLAALWFGRTHPKMDLFLTPFCDFVRHLSVYGFYLNVSEELRHYHAFLLAWCVDSGARGSIQCIHSHNGVSGCNWCLHPGEVEGDGSSARKYLQLPEEPEERTPEQMIRDGTAVLQMGGTDNHVNGVLGLSPILRCPKFHIVHGMVLDNLHWASFGIARRMGKLWLGETKKKKKKPNQVEEVPGAPMPGYYVGSEETKSLINRRIMKLRPPKEVRRIPRKLSHLHDFNAREWENFILFFSVPLFKNILQDRFLRHWILFVQAYYLLMKSKLTKSEVKVAGEFMKAYVDGVEELYGEKEMTFNMHISNHAMNNAIRWGNGYSISTYAFENGNRILKSKINAERGISHQIIRSLDRDSSLAVLRNLASTTQSANFRNRMERKEVKKSFFAGSTRCIMPAPFAASREESWLCQREDVDSSSFSQCRKIIFDKVCYSVDNGKSRTDKSYAFCTDGSIVKIRKIIANEISGQVYFFASKVRCTPYPLPRNVASLRFTPFLYSVDLVEQEVRIYPCSALKTICVNINVDCQFYVGQFISVMPNTSNVF